MCCIKDSLAGKEVAVESAGYNIRLKFIFGLVLFTLLLGSILSITMYFHFDSIMKSEVRQRSRMLLAQSDAVQDYVKTVLRPEMFSILPEDRFVLKAMSSSYISREVMARLNVGDNFTYHYRRVSRNARNPKAAPDALESRLIRFFNENRSVRIWEEDSLVNNEEYYLIARPIVFGESCMSCHGDPDVAPKELIDIYGRTGGFHYEAGEVGGVVVAGFPVALVKDPVKELTLQYLFLYLLGILLFVIVLSLFFDRLVMKNIQVLTLIFKTRFAGQREQRIIQKMERKDEIEGMIEGVDELASCLSDAQNRLEDYAMNLEAMVRDRTRNLIQKADKHHDDVGLLTGLLAGFKEATDVGTLISSVLERVGRRFNAKSVVFHCTNFSDQRYYWVKSVAMEPPGHPSVMAWNDGLLLEDDYLCIPVRSPENRFGMLCIHWPESPDYDDLDAEVLVAIGRQLGVLIENIRSISNIRFQNDMLQSVFDGIAHPLFLIDAEFSVLKANEGSRRVVPEGSDTEQAAALKAFLGPDIIDRSLESILERGTDFAEEMERPDGRFFLVNLYPLPVRENDIVRMVLSIRETTIEKKMATRMQQAERLSSIGKLAAGMAHEINNPLGVISCYTDLVRDTVSDAEVAKDLDMIMKQTETVRKIVQDLLTLARPKQVFSGKCELNRAVGTLAEVFRAQAVSKEIDLVLETTEPLPEIKCDTGIVEQILTNIWLNACDALQQEGGGGIVRISTGLSDSEKTVFLLVEDNGPGIPDDHAEQIFDPFFSTKEPGKGTGLGLSVVYGFMNELGGSIELIRGKMTGFRLSFPIAGESNYE